MSSLNEKPTFTFALVAMVLFWWPSYAWQGWLGSHVWRWFAVEMFGAPPLTTWQIAGLVVFLHFFVPRGWHKPDETKTEALSGVLSHCFLRPLTLFAFAAVIHKVMQ